MGSNEMKYFTQKPLQKTFDSGKAVGESMAST